MHTQETSHPAKRLLAFVERNSQIAQGVHLLQVRATSPIDATPGQFAMLSCADAVFLRRPLSIHRISADKRRMSFLFAVLGKGTQWLAKTKQGDSIDILCPLGNGFNLSPSAKEVLLLAGGIGLAPLVFLAEKALAEDKQVTLAYGTMSSQRYHTDLFPRGIELLEYTDDGSYGKRGLVTECIPYYIDKASQIFACGPLPMYRALARIPELANKDVQVSLETRMACGVGVCYGCTIKTTFGQRQVCHHGPVFSLDSVAWDEMAPI